VLLGVGITGGGIEVGRVGGFALISLGLACWPRGSDAGVQVIWVLLTYNLLAALYHGYLRIGGSFVNYLLWPAFALHALLALLLTRPALRVGRSS
jgi:hypothetical protein